MVCSDMLGHIFNSVWVITGIAEVSQGCKFLGSILYFTSATQSLFLFPHPVLIPTTHKFSLLDKLVSSLVTAGFAISGPALSPARYMGCYRAGHSLQVLAIALPRDGLCPWPLAFGGEVLTALCPALKNHAEPHHVVPGTQQLCYTQRTPDSGTHSGGKGLAQAGKACQESVSIGCLQKALVDRDPVGREKIQPKQLNKYTGGSWQTEKATCRASFRLRVMC